MATLERLCDAGTLTKIEIALPRRYEPGRIICAFPVVIAWIENELPTAASNWNLDETPNDQFGVLLAEYIGGQSLQRDKRFSPLSGGKDGVWELKTADIRVFGWFYRIDMFIAARINFAWTVKESNLYHGYRGEVCRERDAINLDEPKFITGNNPDDVISVWY
jgi:hypothetical protein